ERPRMDFIPRALYDDAEIRDEFEELSEFLLCRIFVDTEQERHFHPGEMLRDRRVGSEHESLDHLLAARACPEDDITCSAILIDQHLRLVEIEVDRTPGFSPIPQYLCKFFSLLEHRVYILEHADQCLVFVHKHFIDRIIRHAAVGMDDT